MLGLFINTLPVRVRLVADMPVAQWLRELQAAQAQARQFEYAPLNKIQTWSDVPRGTTLFDTLLAFENYPVSQSVQIGSTTGFRVTKDRPYSRTVYPLTLSVFAGKTINLRLSWDTEHYKRAAVEGACRDVGLIAKAIGQNPNATITQVLCHLKQEQSQHNKKIHAQITARRTEALFRAKRARDGGRLVN
jgi:non-ribosomal peptide synthetase component F